MPRWSEIRALFSGAEREDYLNLVFRVLFSSIFVGLGAEHIVDDHLIMFLMPSWVPMPHLASAACGLVLLTGAATLLLGWHMKAGARLLSAFLILVTLTVHLPGLFEVPASIAEQWSWLWVVFQRSNFVKNICLLGVCLHLMTHDPGQLSLTALLANRREA